MENMEVERKAEINLDASLAIDAKYIVKKYSEDYLVFFYEMPNWVVFSKSELDAFKDLQKFTVGEVIEHFSEEIVESVLIKLFSRGILGEEHKISDERPKVLPMHIYLTNKCNLRCIHCYMNAGKPLENELSMEDWQEILSGFIEYGGKELSISGGEPFLVPFLPNLIEWVKEKKSSLYIKLLTNGMFLKKLPVDFYNKYVDELQISIDGPTPEIDAYVRGPTHFRIVMSNLEHLKEYKGNVTISMSVVDSLVEQFAKNFKDFYHRVVKIIPKVKFGIATDLMDGRNYKRLEYERAKRNLEIIGDAFSNAAKELNIEIQEEKRFERNVRVISCGYGGTITINSDGYVYPCGVIYGKPLGFYNEKSIAEFAEDLQSIIDQYKVDNLKRCKNCILRYVCGGTCRVENHKVNKDFLTPICTEEAREDMLFAIYRDDLEFEASLS